MTGFWVVVGWIVCLIVAAVFGAFFGPNVRNGIATLGLIAGLLVFSASIGTGPVLGAAVASFVVLWMCGSEVW